MLKRGNDINALKEALEGRGEIREILIDKNSGALIVQFAKKGEWARLRQDSTRQWDVDYYSRQKKEGQG
jgi:hypothetical protein